MALSSLMLPVVANFDLLIVPARLEVAGFSIPDSLPCARHAQKETLLLPMFPDITPEQVERVCGAVRDFYEEDATL